MTYEEKQERRREYLEAKADNLDREAESRFKRGSALLGAMNGQPILIGHHSEKRHRSDIKKMDRDMQKGSEAHKEAKDLRRKAAAVGSGGISSDDENALDKVQSRIEKKERDRDQMKKVNTLYRKRDAAGLEALGLNIERLDAKIADAYSWEKAPFPKWQVSNLTASIRNDKKRLDELQAMDERAPGGELAAGVSDGIAFRFVDDKEENRVICYFDSKPSRRALDLLKTWGWRYSPTRNAHVRKTTPNALAYASTVADTLKGYEKD